MYLIEGNIGVGKSTFLSLIKEYLPSVDCTKEPIDNWANQSFGKSLLEEFYLDPKRWAYTIETLAMICRSRDHVLVQQQHPHHLVERSIYSGHYCFALNGRQEGYFNTLEWDLYEQWVNFLFNQKCKPPHGFIYLQTDPNVCYLRIAKRSRSGESNISLSYLEKIHQWHERFLINKEGVAPRIADVPVLVLDVTKDFASNPERMQEVAQEVAAFIEQTSSPLAVPFAHNNRNQQEL